MASTNPYTPSRLTPPWQGCPLSPSEACGGQRKGWLLGKVIHSPFTEKQQTFLFSGPKSRSPLCIPALWVSWVIPSLEICAF